MARGGRRGGTVKNPGTVIQSEVAMLHAEAGVLRNIQNGVYSQASTCQNFMIRMDALPYNQVATIKNLHISIIGDLIKPINQCCFTVTMIFGMFLIFPLYFMCCGWWKKIVYPAYGIPYKIYEELQTFLMRISYLQTFTLTIVDNTFDRNKAQLLRRIVASKQIKNFIFENWALPVNYNGSEVDQFHQTMHQLKINHPNYNMGWRDEIVE